MRASAAAMATAAAALLAAPAAHAAFPGANGRIAYWIGNAPPVVHEMTPAGGDDLSGPSGQWPAYTPDGDHLVFSSASGSPGIRKGNADFSGTPAVVTSSGDLTPAVSRDGSLIAFVRPDSASTPNRQIWTVPASGGAATQITADANEHLDPAFSPAANRIAYVVGPVNGAHVLHVMDYNGANDTAIPNTSGASDPDFSPDGTKIVYGNGGDIYVANADGSGAPTDIVSGTTTDNDPVYSPDGTKIAFDRVSSGIGQIWVAKADGSNPGAITTSSTISKIDPSWQPVQLPNTVVDGAPPASTNDPTPTFTYHSDQAAGISFECRVDGAAFGTCPASGFTSAPLLDGPHTFEVRAVLTNTGERYVDLTPAETTFTVDTVAPATSINSPSPVPGSTVATSTPSFWFTSSEAGASFECSIDLGSFTPCASGDATPPLPDGVHSFAVQAVDAAGNADPHPPSESFTVDTTPPDTTITNGPPSPTNRPNPRFFFQANDAGATFQCAIDGGAWASCASPYNAPTLSDGSHTLSVRATDTVGNTDPTPATDTVAIDTTAPKTKIISGPRGKVDKHVAKLSFRSNEAGSTFRCKLDGKGYRPCDSPHTYRGLKRGGHTVHVQATDAAGNHDPTPAVRAFRVAG